MYAVEMKVGDNWSEIYKPHETNLTESSVEYRQDYDFYVDVFPTYERAEQFYKANKE